MAKPRSSASRSAKAQSKPKRPRHREGTEASLLEAVGTLLAAGETPGVNAVAKVAKVDKVLVYRYFGDLDGLLTAYADSALFWPSVDELAHDREALLALDFADRYCLLLQRYARALRARPATLSILAAETMQRSALHAPIEQARETFGAAMFELARDAPEGFDLAAVTSVLTSAIHYLLLRARHISLFSGIAIRTDEGFDRIERAIERLARGALATRGSR
jgi:AcrR family transcriptional regulator